MNVAQLNSTAPAKDFDVEKIRGDFPILHQRVYDQRENAIQSLCERPVQLEETLSSVLRELAIYLP